MANFGLKIALLTVGVPLALGAIVLVTEASETLPERLPIPDIKQKAKDAQNYKNQARLDFRNYMVAQIINAKDFPVEVKIPYNPNLSSKEQQELLLAFKDEVEKAGYIVTSLDFDLILVSLPD